MRLTRLAKVLLSGAFALVYALVPAQGRGQQAELFALLAFLLLASASSSFTPGRRARA